ncbi:MAG: AAA family ATPase [Lachnospiraceae bacterium]|nr:AAA family ATPase [Lachnospiraceae bacterium]
MAWKSIADETSKEYIRHSYILLNEEISDSYKDTFQYYMRGIYNINECIGAINLLSECLSQAHKQQVIIIIDEYNTPIEHALIKGFCTEMLTFINSFYEKSITNNAHLKFAIMAECYPHTVDTIFIR